MSQMQQCDYSFLPFLEYEKSQLPFLILVVAISISISSSISSLSLIDVIYRQFGSYKPCKKLQGCGCSLKIGG